MLLIGILNVKHYLHPLNDSWECTPTWNNGRFDKTQDLFNLCFSVTRKSNFLLTCTLIYHVNHLIMINHLQHAGRKTGTGRSPLTHLYLTMRHGLHGVIGVQIISLQENHQESPMINVWCSMEATGLIPDVVVVPSFITTYVKEVSVLVHSVPVHHFCLIIPWWFSDTS